MSTQPLKTIEEQEAFVKQALTKAEELRKKKEYKEGIALLVDALQYGIDKATIYYRLGNIYIDGGDFGRAEYAYKRALEVEPHHVNAMHNLAIVYKRQKKVSLFVKTYKKAQRMEISHPRKVALTPEQRNHVRRIGIKYLLWFLAGGVIVALILFLIFR